MANAAAQGGGSCLRVGCVVPSSGMQFDSTILYLHLELGTCGRHLQWLK